MCFIRIWWYTDIRMPQWWKQHNPIKHCYISTRLYVVTSQKVASIQIWFSKYNYTLFLAHEEWLG